MNDKKATDFEATLNPLELRRMRDQADQIAKEQGLTKNDDIDAFRHAYVSAKVAEKYGKTSAKIVGHGNEWLREGVNRAESLGKEGNPKDQWQQDVSNNDHGIAKNAELDKQNLSKEEKERRLRKELADDVRNGKLQTRPDPNNRRYYPDQGEEKTESSKQPSILDGIGDTLGAVGSAAATVGHMAYDTAMSMSKDTLVHMMTQAANGGGGKAVLAQAAQVAMAQTLSRMHGLVMQEVERQQPSQPWRTPGIAGPILEPDGTTQESIERTINDPRNAGIFNDIASRVERILTQVGDVHPAAVLVSKVIEVLRGGNIKVQPNIFVPELLPQENGPARVPQGDERVVEIGGVSIPVRLPDVRVIMDEAKGSTPDFSSDVLYSSHGDMVNVKGYTRGDGTQVSAHSRTAPDGIVSNNFSFRQKG
jgi:hypothetical protein